jgi:hypothetical protein
LLRSKEIFAVDDMLDETTASEQCSTRLYSNILRISEHRFGFDEMMKETRTNE